MLVILYITSIATSFYTSILIEKEEYENYSKYAMIAIISGTIYSIVMIFKVYQDISNLNFWTVFGFLSLLFIDFAFMTSDGENCLSYLAIAFLASTIVCFLCSNIHFSDYLVPCNQNHDYTERVSIVTTVDGLKYGKSIYGDGFVVGMSNNSSGSATFYQYYFKTEDGNIKSEKFNAKRATITYIDDGVAPYVEINYEITCKGYRNRSNVHVYGKLRKTYHLFIPKNSIQTNITPAS